MEVAALRNLRLGSASQGTASCSSASSASSSSRRSNGRAASPTPDDAEGADAYRRHRQNRSAGARRKHTMSSERLSTGSSRSSASSGSSRRHSSSGGSDAALNLPLGHEFLPLPHDQDDEEGGGGGGGGGGAPADDEAAARDQVRHDVLCMLFDLPNATVFYQGEAD